ncbi:hypothetical protein G6F68_010209 [Rhizopus microsporus]|nr:hypothetical protein G6F68_010209 [Rhizopus microsporus]
MPALERPPGQPRQPGFHAVQRIAVAHQQAHQADQIVAGPHAVAERLAGPDTALCGDEPVEAHVADGQAHERRAVAQRLAAQAVFDCQPAAGQSREARNQALAQQAV